MLTDAQKEAISRLPVATRMDLLEAISESLTDNQRPLTDEHRELLDRRLAEHRADPEAGADLDTVLTRLAIGS